MTQATPPRREDQRLLTGGGRFIDDIVLPRQLQARFLRSPHAHAAIRAVDLTAARAVPGVVAIYTGADVARLGLGSLPCVMPPTPKPGTKLVMPPHPPLAVERARHVGEAVAMVVAERAEIAADALDRIIVDYEALPAAVEARRASDAGAPLVHAAASRNLCLEWAAGDAKATSAALARAAHRVSLDLHNNRLASTPLEPRGALAEICPISGRLTLYLPSQGVHELRAQLAEHVLGVPESSLRLVTPDVGGSFGAKMYLYPEYVMVLAAARELRRPVKWTAERGESFLSDNQARDVTTVAELGLDAEGRFLALQVRSWANMGAYLGGYGPSIPTVVGVPALAGPYRTPAIHVEVDCVFTHTVPVDAYRGAGRPEMTFVIERLIDIAARELAIDPAELRRRNLIAPEAIPYATPLGITYDSGEFRVPFERALALADWAGFAARRAAATRQGKLRGIGLCSYVEPCGSHRNQRVDLRFARDGSLTLLVGSQSTGMGHESFYAGLAAERLGYPQGAIGVVQGDSDLVPFGRWTSGSRTAAVGGTALHLAMERMLDKARAIAAHLLEAAPADLAFERGDFVVAGTDRRLALIDVVKASFDYRRLPAGMEPGLDQAADYMDLAGTYPNGTHVCEVEIDADTGMVRIVSYVAVDDFGHVVDEKIVEGQLQGGLAQGIGQALFEDCIYDPQSGQLLAGSLLDYTLPRADDLGAFVLDRTETRCRTNPLGVKGCGETGAIAAPPAVINAVVDALAGHGLRHLDMPATPARVWRALQASRERPHSGGAQ